MKYSSLLKIAGILMSAGLVISLLGSGVGASFAWNGQSSQHITVADPHVTFSQSCAVFHVTTSTGSVNCGIVVTTDPPPYYVCDTCPEVYPTTMTIAASVSGSKLAEPGKWTITDVLPAGASYGLDALPRTFGPYGMSRSVYGYGGENYRIAWTDLSSASLGDDFTVDFTIIAYQ